MHPRHKKWLKNFIRWGIAVVGIWYVIAHMAFNDRTLVRDPDTGLPAYVRVMAVDGNNLTILDDTRDEPVERQVTFADLWTPPDRKTIQIRNSAGQIERANILAIKPPPIKNPHGYAPTAILIEDAKGQGVIADHGQIVGGYLIQVPYPLIDVGLNNRVRQASPWFLWGSIAIFPITFIITSIRWHALLKVLGIVITLRRAVAINMVGSFYNTFMPGSTGGDLAKAYYAAKQTSNRTFAILTVIVDRVIGLLALVLLGGAMAAVQYFISADKHSAIAQSCFKVAILCGGILGGTALGLFIAFNPLTRKILGLDFMLRKLPMQSQVQRTIEAMAIYRSRPVLMIGALLGSLPVHITVVVSALLAGKAFNLPLDPLYYFVAVPIIVLVGAIPVSPQGAGVMEFFAIRLTERHGCSVADAFILTMSIRIVQMLWNLTGGIFVLKGGFHAPTPAETEALDDPATSTS